MIQRTWTIYACIGNGRKLRTRLTCRGNNKTDVGHVGQNEASHTWVAYMHTTLVVE